MANAAFRDVSFLLRREHNEQVAKILSDPEASENDKYVALTFLRNAEVSVKGKLPLCQDTGTAIAGEKVYVVDGKAINEEGNISGSTITLYQAVRNLMKFAGVSYAEALAYATIVPATEVGIDAVTGSIEEGKRADLLLVDAETYDIKSVWQAGMSVQ